MVLLVTGMLVDLPVSIIQVTVSVTTIHLEVSAAHMQVTGSAENMWMTIVVIIQMGVSVAIMLVVFSAVDDVHAGGSFFNSYVGDSFK